MHWGWWSSTMHFRFRNLATDVKQCLGTRPHKGGGKLQVTTQTKIYKLQTNSTNKHCLWKCKTRSKQTKGKGVGQVLLTTRGDGEVSEACWHIPPCTCVHATTTCTRKCIGTKSHKGRARTLNKNLHKTTHKSKTIQGEEGRRILNKNRSSFFLSSSEAKKKKKLIQGGSMLFYSHLR